MAHVKDAYTFLHDANARNDGRVLQLRALHGLEGYGFYFALLELMRESTNYKLSEKLSAGYALQLGLEPSKFKTLLDSCIAADDLLTVENGEIFSRSFLARMEVYDEKRNRLRANAVQLHNKRKAKAEQKQSRCRASVYIEQEQECTKIGEYFTADPERLAKLRDEWGLQRLDYWIAAFNDYLAQDPSKRNKYRDHLATLRNWDRRAKEEGKGWYARGGAAELAMNNHPARKIIKAGDPV